MDIMDCLISPYATQPMENVHNHFTVDAISQYLPYNYSVAQSFRQDGYMGWESVHPQRNGHCGKHDAVPR